MQSAPMLNNADVLWLLPVGVCVAIAAMAQLWKARTGAGWGVLTFLVITGMWAVLVELTPSIDASPDRLLVRVIMASILGGGLMALIVATLPQRQMTLPEHQPPLQGEGMRPCPYCAEAIRAEAIKCRYCQSDLPQT